MSTSALQLFAHSLSASTTSEQAFSALHTLTSALVGSRLFTIMSVDMARMEASRCFSDDPVNYAVSGIKPVEMNSWFEVIHTEGRTFVANSLADIAKVFPDHELIGSLGCGSVVNLPIVLESHLVATLNILHEEQYYTDARVRVIEQQLLLPSMAAWLVHSRLSTASP